MSNKPRMRMLKESAKISDNTYRLLKEPAKRKRARERAFRPFAIQLGWITYEWNRLQESLGELFCDIVHPKANRIGRAIWHSTDNDRALRNILQAALEAGKTDNGVKPHVYDDVSWILSQFNKLAGRRNAALHAPLGMFSSSVADPEFQIEPLHHLGHPRAVELKDKSLIEEFRWYRDHLEKLADFAEELHFGLNFPELAWPDRPQLLSRGQFQIRRGSRRKNKAK
jgi:hypothetical protein